MPTPEEALNYQTTERTRFKVLIDVTPGRDACVPGRITLHHLMSLTDAQVAYMATREECGLGGSQFSEGHVCDEQGQHIARISYNGRIWEPVAWNREQKPVAEAPSLPVKVPLFSAAFTPAPFLTEVL